MFFKIKKEKKQKDQCARCGACLSFCPVYKAMPIERYSPRGKNYLLRCATIKKRQQPIKQTVNACLQCGACSTLCSAGTDVAALIREERRKNRYFQSFPPSMFGAWEKFGQEKGVKVLSYLERISPLLKDFTSQIPLSDKPFLSNLNYYASSYPGSISLCQIPQSIKKSRILLFCGCMQNYLFPHTVSKIAALFHWEVIIPEQQVCCGLPAYSQGASDNAKNFAKKNISIFSKYQPDVILTGCASCAYMINNWDKLFHEKEGEAKEAKQISKRVMELSQFLSRLQMQIVSQIDCKIAIQIPCHQRYGLSASSTPIDVVQGVLRDKKNHIGNLGCCGLGGTFSILNSDLSKTIFKKNIASVIQSITLKNPLTITTTCSGCLFRLRYGMESLYQEKGHGVTAAHLVDLLVKID